MKNLLTGAVALALIACGGEAVNSDQAVTGANQTSVPETAEIVAAKAANSERLAAVLDAQSDETKERYQYRHPQATLEFFGIEPGMAVVDTLPGTPGWYAPILISYLGEGGRLIGADYSLEMWTLEGVDEEWLEKRKNWKDDYVTSAEEHRGEDDAAAVAAYVYGSAPAEMAGEVDAVLMIRATHHFNRFEEEGGFFTSALAEVMMVLKPGGILGVVQHRSPETNPDAWAEGDNGYVKQSQVISFVEAAGFEFLESSEINANPNDQPTVDDRVWRLPPTLGSSREDEELKAQMLAIGESDRMTLKFMKPK